MARREDPRKSAVALKYDPENDQAPVVIAKGKGHLATQIMKLAKENQIPIREDKNLVQVLSMMKLDQQIPPQAFQAVALILAFVMKLQKNQKPG
jgi:flagellar biosynthesis protein